MNVLSSTLLIILLNLFFNGFTIAATNYQLEDKFQHLLNRFLSEAKDRNQHEHDISIEKLILDLKSLADKERASSQSGKQNLAKAKLDILIFVRQNLNLLVEKLTDKQQLSLINALLILNDQTTANLFWEAVSNYNDSYQTTLLAIEFAENAYDRNKWAEVLNFLDIDLESLPIDKLEKSYFLKAVALQKLKKHRDSLKYYELVPESSAFYELAQLNRAIALIRQDWWSDAHSIIKKLIKTKTLNEQDELTNRLYLMIGYSLLRNEYLREARQAFRSITLDSQYLSKSLFGISLVAIKQKDYHGAMNSLKLIQDQNEDNLETYEVNLLMPLIYQNLGQTKAAIAGYESAIQFYQNKLQEIDLLKGRSLNMSNGEVSKKASCYSQSNLSLLSEMLSFEIAESLLKETKELKAKYESCAEETKLAEIGSIRTAIQSYLSQSRFALAKLYDDNDE